MSINFQVSSYARVRAALGKAKETLGSVDAGLRPEARAERIAAIRAQSVADLEPVRKKMSELETEARLTLPTFSQEAIRRRAKFASDPAVDAQTRMATLATLRMTGTGELLNHLQDAIADKNIAKAEAVRLEFGGRADKKHFAMQFDVLFKDVVDPFARRREIELQQTIGVASLAEVYIREFASGKLNPIDRMTAARAAGPAGNLDEREANQ